jgi:hypothetical protein
MIGEECAKWDMTTMKTRLRSATVQDTSCAVCLRMGKAISPSSGPYSPNFAE